MVVSVAKTPVTADELPALSARLSALGKRAELVGGGLVVMAPAGGRHGEVAHTLALFIGNHVRKRNLGRVFAAETGFVLRRDPDTVRAPDVAFVAAERLQAEETPAGFLESAPDLAIEVVSPGDAATAVRDKQPVVKSPALHRDGRRARLTRREEGAYRAICDRRTTPSGGMRRPANAGGTFATGCKVQDWLEAGTRLVWVVCPRTRSVVVHRPGRPAEALRDDDDLQGGSVLPDFAVPVRDLFT